MALLVGLVAVDSRADADALFAKGNFPEAASIYANLLKTSPDDPVLLHSLGQALRALRRPDQALPYLLRETQIAPKDHVAARILATAMQEANEFSQGSIQFLAKLAASDPGNGDIWHRRGLLLYQNGYYGAALEDLDKALAALALGDRNGAESTRAICLMETGRSDEAEKAYRELLTRPANGRNLDLLLGYSRIEYEAGRYDSALRWTDRALAANGDNASAHFWRARVLQQQNKLPEAAAEAERSRDLSPGSPSPRNLLIRIYQKLGRTEDAAREAEWIRGHQVPGEAR